MHTFVDTKNRTWNLSLTLGAAKRVRDLLGINLLEPEAGDPPLLTRLGTDPILLLDVIYCLVEPQAQKDGVSDVEFGESLGGDAVLQAQQALYEELIDFFRRSGRTDRAEALATQQRVIALAIQRTLTEIEGMDLEASLAQAGLGPTHGSSSTNSPASSASSPRGSPSAN
ncbi:MAG: hypothetical protein JXQ75_03185 [Phycisphaerae bacterium]|nr:hypothetical protein [Phycisphaerae bacterium]